MQASLDEVGYNPDDAIDKALKKIGLSRDKVMVQVLPDIEGYNSSLARVRITPLGEPPEPLQVGPILEELLHKMGFEATISLSLQDDEVNLVIDSEMSGLIIGKNGATIDALQHIINRIVNRTLRNKSRIIIDIKGYRQKKESYLIALARKSAQIVNETGKPVDLEPLNPHDRRIIHLELQSDPDIQTSSLGEGFLKSIRISRSSA